MMSRMVDNNALSRIGHKQQITSSKGIGRNRGVVSSKMLAAFACAGLLGFAGQAADAQIQSAKRGFGDTGSYYGNLQAVNAGWYYTWGSDKPNIGNYDADFVPMLWGSWAANQSTIDKIVGYGDIEWVLGFNEPERSDQANLTVSQAISAWQTLDAGFDGTGIKLVSPAVSDTSGGQSWLSSFMSQANSQGLQVDAVAFHWYGVSTPNDPSGAAYSFLSRVDSYHNQYGLPVWITEFAIHDWGGNYSDAEVRAANAAFLDIVVPALESRSYVGGYAFYNWFGDSKMIEGSPLTPTNVGKKYVGVIERGQTYDFNNEDLGEHIAYLEGGKLTVTREAGTVRYISALGEVSEISGSVDWSMNAASNWVRVLDGATLRKTGSNKITLSGVDVSNNGLLEVAEGTLRFEYYPTLHGTGELRVLDGGTLELHGTRGETAATMDFDVELRGGTIGSDMVDGMIVAGGAMLEGEGAVSSSLRTQSGAVIRVGDAGMSAPARFTVDDFESYATGNLRDVASPPWTAHEDTGFADIEDHWGNQVLTYGWSDNYRSASRTMPEDGEISDSETATFFFRFNAKVDDPDVSFGLGTVANTNGTTFSNYETQLRIVEGATSGTIQIDARDGSGFSSILSSGLSLDSWYNIWMVIDQTTDTYDIYMNTGTADATVANKLNSSPLAFRNGTTEVLDEILAYGGPASADNTVRFDDLTYLNGIDLTNPLAGFDAGLVLEPAVLTVAGDMVLVDGAVLELDVYDPSAMDRVDVSGIFTAGGTLSVALTDGAPSPRAGDVFDILDFTYASGAFDVLDLPVLETGLAWNTSALLITGELSVASIQLLGDLNGDGYVGLDDLDIVLTAWNQNVTAGDWSAGDPSGDGFVGLADLDFVLSNWNAGTPPTIQGDIPEPMSVVLMGLGCVTLMKRYRFEK